MAEGLVKGRIVYFVFDVASAEEVTRRRTTGPTIARRLQDQPPTWPAGAQAHIGNHVQAGDVCPAMVVAVLGGDQVNLKVMLDGSDEYWATSVHYSEEKLQRSWHWMFTGQQSRYVPPQPQGGQ